MAFTAEAIGPCSKESYSKEKNNVKPASSWRSLLLLNGILKLEMHVVATEKPIHSRNRASEQNWEHNKCWRCCSNPSSKVV